MSPQSLRLEDSAAVTKVKVELDNFVVYIQRYIETQLNWMSRVAKMPSRSFEEKMETIEWAVRHAEFISSDEQQKFLTSFRELYTSNDLNTRNSFIKATHASDTVLFMSATLE